MNIRFDDRVAIVTGAGAGLGRSHALGFAARGAKVAVNDMSPDAAREVVREIVANGGEAEAFPASVADSAQVIDMVDAVMRKWGRVDVLANNAGIVRDKTFSKMDMADFRLVVDVHLMGSTYCTKAVWDIMRAQNYGRIVMTTSGSGIYGNFGQANYAAAKAGLVGLMNVLAIEGQRNDIRVNSIAPVAATAMTEGVLTPDSLRQLAPEAVTPGLLFLASEDAPTGLILGAGAGCFAVVQMLESEGFHLAGASLSPEGIAGRFADLQDMRAARRLPSSIEQSLKYVRMAAADAESTQATNP